ANLAANRINELFAPSIRGANLAANRINELFAPSIRGANLAANRINELFAPSIRGANLAVNRMHKSLAPSIRGFREISRRMEEHTAPGMQAFLQKVEQIVIPANAHLRDLFSDVCHVCLASESIRHIRTGESKDLLEFFASAQCSNPAHEQIHDYLRSTGEKMRDDKEALRLLEENGMYAAAESLCDAKFLFDNRKYRGAVIFCIRAIEAALFVARKKDVKLFPGLDSFLKGKDRCVWDLTNQLWKLSNDAYLTRHAKLTSPVKIGKKEAALIHSLSMGICVYLVNKKNRDKKSIH
ncbi:MAG: hypothetical protein MPL62_14415, partial [Alphaproteobacteria bacterium]|nr:hypothetical protein [Alphaproteobacteria bacterium]